MSRDRNKQASESILALKPVTFHYKSDKSNTPQFGLVAEDVAQVNSDLVVRNKDGEIYSVRYDAVNAMLLNEFLKEHKRVEAQNQQLQDQGKAIEKQETTIAELRCIVTKQEKGIEALAAHVKEQDSKIQRVRTQVEISTPAPKLAVNGR